MAAQISLPITNYSGSVQYYRVDYKLSSELNYTFYSNQFTSPIVLDNLISDVNYDIQVTTYCTNGANSGTSTTTILTTP